MDESANWDRVLSEVPESHVITRDLIASIALAVQDEVNPWSGIAALIAAVREVETRFLALEERLGETWLPNDVPPSFRG